jgi:hypothetical protein
VINDHPPLNRIHLLAKVDLDIISVFWIQIILYFIVLTFIMTCVTFILGDVDHIHITPLFHCRRYGQVVAQHVWKN